MNVPTVFDLVVGDPVMLCLYIMMCPLCKGVAETLCVALGLQAAQKLAHGRAFTVPLKKYTHDVWFLILLAVLHLIDG